MIHSNSNKKTFIQIIIIGFLIILTGCYTLKGHVGASDNIIESKKIGAFICEYYVDNYSYKINDTMTILIKEVWLEKMWRYTGMYSKPQIIDNHYQICINTSKNSLKGYRDKWTIGNGPMSEFRDGSDSSLLVNMDTIPQSNEIVYNVFKGSYEFHNIGKLIGKIVLKKK